MILTKLIEWVCVVLLALWGLTAFGGCNATPETVKILDGTLKTLNSNGVVYSGTLEGPTEAGFEMYSGGRVTTGGWISLRLQSPVGNPMAEVPDGGDGAGTEAAVEPDGDDVSFGPATSPRRLPRFENPTARTAAHWKPPAQPSETARPARVAFDPDEVRRVVTVKAGVVSVAWFRGVTPIAAPQ